MNRFKLLQIPEAHRYWIRQARVPTCFLPDWPKTTLDRNGATLVDLLVDNFYEWKKTNSGKQPYAIALADRRLMALAGIWENWRSAVGEWVRSFAIITTTPNELCAELHDRMPLVLAPETWPAWLGEEPADPRPTQSRSCALSGGGDDLLAGERAGRERQEQ